MRLFVLKCYHFVVSICADPNKYVMHLKIIHFYVGYMQRLSYRK